MGSAENEPGRDPDEHPHQVILSQDFLIGKTEVSQELYLSINNNNPSFFSHPQNPVESVSWLECINFCNQFSRHHNLKEAYQVTDNGAVIWDSQASGYRLPTEAEWEYTAKKTNQHTGWSLLNSKLKPHRIGHQVSNGISDMAGNVWEWCWDWYGPYPSEKSPTHEPTGLPSGKYRVVKGGSWIDNARILRPANRAKATPDHKSNTIGFRLARWDIAGDAE